MARVQFRPRRASGTFFPVSPYRPVWVRVRVGGSSVVLACFPWRASSFVHDGRRAPFSRVHVPPVLGPCKGPCTRRCLVGGFAQFSMARVQFRPRRASGTFFPVSPYRPFWVRVRVRVRVGGSSVVLPSFPWRASSSAHDGRRALFSRVPVPPVLGPCTGPCTRRWFWPVFHGARPAPSTTGVGHFFPVSTYRPFWVRVRVGGSSVVLACFSSRVSSSVPHGRQAV